MDPSPSDGTDKSRAPEADAEPQRPPIPIPKGTKRWSREGWVRVYAEKGTVKAACEAVGIHRDTAYEERKRNPAFAEAWEREESAVTDVLEKTLVEIAIDGEGSPQVRALEFALKARRPTKYRERIDVKHGGKVGVEVEEAVDEEVEDALAEVDRLTDELAKAKAAGGVEPVAAGSESEVPGGVEGSIVEPSS